MPSNVFMAKRLKEEKSLTAFSNADASSANNFRLINR